MKKIVKDLQQAKTPEQVENIVEKNPEQAKQVLPESELKQEAEQIGDGDKRTDEVKDSAAKDFLDKAKNFIVGLGSGGASSSTPASVSVSSSETPVEAFQGESSIKTSLGTPNTNFATGGSSSIDTSSAGISQRLSTNKNNSNVRVSGGNITPQVSRQERPGTSTSKIQSRQEERRPGIIGWNTVSSAGSAGSLSGKSTAPKMKIQKSKVSGAKLDKIDIKDMIDKNKVYRELIKESSKWPVDESGVRNSGTRYLPIKLYVDGANVEYVMLGSGAKRKSIQEAPVRDLQIIASFVSR